MRKKLLAAFIALTLIFCSVPAMAAVSSPYSETVLDTKDETANTYDESADISDEPVIFKDTITVSPEGGEYQIGFVTLRFPKNFLPEDNYPVTFEVEVAAKEGEPGVEITPVSEGFPEEGFLKKVQIRVDKYKGLLFDEASGQNIDVETKHNVLNVRHFSRYAFS